MIIQFFRFFTFISLVFFLFLGGLAWSKPLYIAVMDSPFDLNHPKIKEHTDFQVLHQSIMINPQTGEPFSLYDYNLQRREYWLSYYTEKMKENGIELDQAILIYLLRTVQKSKLWNETLDWAQQNPKTRDLFKHLNINDLDSYGDIYLSPLFHGSHVAGIMLNEVPKDIRIVPVPQLAHIEITTPLKSLDEAFAHHKKVVTSYFSALDKTLKETNIKVMNASLGFGLDESIFFFS